MSRILTEVLARRFDEDLALVEEMLALAPEGADAWRPDWPVPVDGDLPFTLGELAAHLVMCWGGVLACLWKLHPEALPHAGAWRQQSERGGAGVAQALALLRSGRELARLGFSQVRDEDLARGIGTHFSPQGQPALETLWINAKHVNHHAHQLFVYLKLMGVAVNTRHLYRFAGA